MSLQPLVESASMFSKVLISSLLCHNDTIYNDKYLFKEITCRKTNIFIRYSSKKLVLQPLKDSGLEKYVKFTEINSPFCHNDPIIIVELEYLIRFNG